MPILQLIVPGDPISKGRPRSGPAGNFYTPRRTQVAEAQIKQLALEARGDQMPAAGPVGITVECFCATRRRSDGDNMLKLVTDALNGVAYVDDYLIEEYFCRVHRGVGKDMARLEIMVWELSDDERTIESQGAGTEMRLVPSTSAV